MVTSKLIIPIDYIISGEGGSSHPEVGRMNHPVEVLAAAGSEVHIQNQWDESFHGISEISLGTVIPLLLPSFLRGKTGNFLLAHSNSKLWRMLNFRKSPSLLWWPQIFLTHIFALFNQWQTQPVPCRENSCYMSQATFYLLVFLFFFFLNSSLIILNLRGFLSVSTLSVFRACPITKRNLSVEACMWFCEQVGIHQQGDISRMATWFSAGRCKLALPVPRASQKLCNVPSLI